jgi:Reverse transcriptase (RNA-dependent DNA polymerase)
LKRSQQYFPRRSEIVPSANVSVRDALRTRGNEAKTVIIKELKQIIDRKVWGPIKSHTLTRAEASKVIPSSMFLKMKTNPNGSFNKYKARLVAGGHRQDKGLYDDLSSPTVSSSGVFAVIAIAAHEHRHVAVVDIGGAFLHADMTAGVPGHMRLDKTMSDFLVSIDGKYKEYVSDKGTVTVLLKKALYWCVESAALWYENLSTTMKSMGYNRNDSDICTFNKRNVKGQQCTVCVHVDDLLITSVSKSIMNELTSRLGKRYGEISLTHGTVIDYLGMSLDFTVPGEARLTMAGYVQEILTTSGVTGTAKTPATDGLFEMRGDAASVPGFVRVWFHRVVAQLLYLAKRIKPECLTAVAYLATRVTKCDADDTEKLHRLVRYVRHTEEAGVVLRLGATGIAVRLYVEASYGVHGDGKSHTGSCIVVGDVGAVHCRSTKQNLVTKSSTEAELVGMSDSANQALHLRNFLIQQGYAMGPVTVYQDNMSCMTLKARVRSGVELTRHISIRYFWTKESVNLREMRVVHKGTKEMYANVLTKPLQGSQFAYERDSLTGWTTPTEYKTSV